MNRRAVLFSALALCALFTSCCAQQKLLELPLERYLDKCRGAWAGQMIGVTYGDWSEFKWRGFYYEGEMQPWTPDRVARAINQDDCYVEMTFLKCLEQFGLGVTFEQAGEAFAASKYRLWHANRAGRDNCRKGIMPPLSGHYSNNPHFDDIDFQIESDFTGIVCPGMPATCNKLCNVFGHVMNFGDGVYGGSFIGGMYAAAFFESDVERVVRAGLANVPRDSFYAAVIRDVLAQYAKNPDDPRPCWRYIQQKWAWMDHCGRDNPFNIDAKLNGAYVAIGLLWGKGDMARTLEIATRCGQDSDCNPSSAGGVLGCILGYRAIPKQFTAGIPAIADRKFSYTDYSFNMLGDVCAKIAREIVLANGGKVVQRGGKEVWLVPVEQPKPLPLEQWFDADFLLRLKVTPAVGKQAQVLLRWRRIPTARGYRIFRAEEGGKPVELARVGDVDHWADASAQPGKRYFYSLKVVMPYGEMGPTKPVLGGRVAGAPKNEKSDENLALRPTAYADARITAPTGSGLKNIEVIRNGNVAENYDSFDGDNKLDLDWYAIRFLEPVTVNEVVYIEGKHFNDGGWWTSLWVQYLDLDTGQWTNVSGLQIRPRYNFADKREGRKPFGRYVLTFDPVACAGVRIIGEPGGSADFTSIAELEVFYR